MKKSRTQYVIFDPKTKWFWQRNDHYAYYTYGQRFAAVFTKDLNQATQLTRKSAEELLKSFDERDRYVIKGSASFDRLQIAKAFITIDVPLRKKWFPW